jgi:5'-3' exoribonuclease 1
MQRLHRYIESWIKANRANLPPVVVYSSHLVPGEGEHKIFGFIRRKIIEQGDTFNYHLVYGLDADLVMLSSLSPMQRILLVRENFEDIIDIDALKAGIVNDLTSDMSEKPDDELVIQDFVLMVYFIGNDFLPHMMAFEDVGLAIKFMFIEYKKLDATMTKENGEIDWPALTNFVYLMASREEELLKDKASESFVFPSKILDTVTERKEIPVVRRGDKHYQVTKFDYEKFRTLWYFQAFGPRTDEGKLLVEELKVQVTQTSSIDDMCRSYMFGLQWVMQYYIGGNISTKYIYPYYHCPLLSDLSLVLIADAKAEPPRTPSLNSVLAKEGDIKLNPYHQLLAVIPPASKIQIPAEVRHLITGSLADMCPVNFILELEGKDKEFQGIPILPNLDVVRIIDAVQKVTRGELPKELMEDTDWISKITERIVIPYVQLSLSSHGRGRGRGRSEDRGGSSRGRGDGKGRGRGEGRGRGRGRGENRGRGRIENTFRGTPSIRGAPSIRGVSTQPATTVAAAWSETDLLM